VSALLRRGALEDAVRRAAATAARFPFVLFAALVATGAAQIAIDRPNADDLVRLVFSAGLGLPLLFAVAVTAERNARFRWAGLAASVTCALALAAFHAIATGWPDPLQVTRYAHLAVAFHLLVAVLPFWGGGTLRGFWQYNRILFLRFLIATLYAAVLFGGLALALVALDNLFGIDIDDDTYLRLWVVLAFIFHPWFFLAGVPRDLDALDEREDYPVGLKVFAQFVLIPLVTVYLLILTAYLVRVIVTQTWPSGWIGYLVSSVAAVGTLALLLVHPVRERADARWVDAYGRWFYIALLPSIAMLLMAVGLRLEQYGFTEQRYFLLLLSIWLAGIAIFYGVTGSRNIRVIPASLCVFAFLTFVGPWSAYAVSKRSQANRLASLLEQNGILAGEALRPATAPVSYEDRREISATVRYLVSTHGAPSLATVHPTLTDSVPPDDEPVGPDRSVPPGYYSDDPTAARIVEGLGLAYVSRYEAQQESQQYFSMYASEAMPIEIGGYDLLVRVELTTSPRIALGGDTLVIRSEPTGQYGVRFRSRQIGTLPLDSLARTLVSEGVPPRGMLDLPVEGRTLDVASGDVRVRFILWQFAGSFDDEGAPQINSASGVVLVDVR
jgi:hypothetical protein